MPSSPNDAPGGDSSAERYIHSLDMTEEELLALVRSGTISSSDFLAYLWPLSKGHTRRGASISPRESDIYRTRVYAADARRPRLVRELSYPPSTVAGIGRANLRGEPMFYASAGMPTTLVESRVQQGEVVVAGRWRINAELMLQVIGFEEEPDGIESLYHEIFTAPDASKYPYSAAVAKHLIGGQAIHGILYPSIISSNKSHNVAIKPSFADRCLELLYASAIRVETITDSSYRTHEIDFARPNKTGELQWTGEKRRWTLATQGAQLTFVANGWDWNAYLPDGTWVMPE